jgi:hypothetical protein
MIKKIPELTIAFSNSLVHAAASDMSPTRRLILFDEGMTVPGLIGLPRIVWSSSGA